ncbi:TIGR03085 family metal-binding protein [Quadrisphaera sp. DSM 44207]|uniref:TIGR03085 family metal-binding protein n=1 Tax=Quadrisphaera sp. DSM 44207 TaxID=1881057 RepID=UPI000886B566|nr:TIGR03085 family metal-binding protein [Quadrisphaera sp. DSM 44207]SDQ45577.1 TIGR03085 family protein [Quadrisphaera sp. DSM 44207]
MTGTDRSRLADLMVEAGPQAPTLDEGWSVRDLAAHLVVRERRPDAGLALLASGLSPALARHAEAVRRRAARQPFEELVARFRAGPPRWSPLALPGAEAAVNAVEFFVHGEDVNRAREGWQPQPLRPGQREALWKALRRQSRLLYRRSPVGVVLAVPAGPRAVALRRPVSVVVTGQPEELVLHAFGRRSVARVEVTGPPQAVRALAQAPLSV